MLFNHWFRDWQTGLPVVLQWGSSPEQILIVTSYVPQVEETHYNGLSSAVKWANRTFQQHAD